MQRLFAISLLVLCALLTGCASPQKPGLPRQIAGRLLDATVQGCQDETPVPELYQNKTWLCHAKLVEETCNLICVSHGNPDRNGEQVVFK